eukprot:2242311-Prymnesium_polylepis.1
MDSSESLPESAEDFTGTPITGRGVIAATILQETGTSSELECTNGACAWQRLTLADARRRQRQR